MHIVTIDHQLDKAGIPFLVTGQSDLTDVLDSAIHFSTPSKS